MNNGLDVHLQGGMIEEAGAAFGIEYTTYEKKIASADPRWGLDAPAIL